MAMYKVEAVKNRYFKGAGGKRFLADEGYITYRTHQVAESADAAIECAKTYYMPAGTQYDFMRAELVPHDSMRAEFEADD